MIVVDSRSGARVCKASVCHGLRHEAGGSETGIGIKDEFGVACNRSDGG